MIPAARRADRRLRVILILAAPAAVLAGSLLAQLWLRATPTAELLDQRERTLRARFGELLDSAKQIADTASGPESLPGLAAAHPALAQRVEGSGTLASDGSFLAWNGTPAEPPPGFVDAAAPTFWLSLDGVRTRLLVRSGPDEQGRYGLASFVIDSALEAERFEKLLPAELQHGVATEVSFRDSRNTDPPASAEPRPDRRNVVLAADGGQILATAEILALDPAHRAREIWRRGLAWAALLVVSLTAALFDWRRLEQTPAGAGLAAAGVLCGRMLLAAADVPEHLLPRDLSTASLYGLPGFFGWLASPSDLLLTSIALFMLCVIASRCAAAGVGRRWTVSCFALGAAITATACAFGIVVSVSRNSRIELVDQPGPFLNAGRALLWLIVVLALLGAAELWVRSISVLRTPSGRPRAPRAAVAFTLVLLAAATSVLTHALATHYALEQIASELAPQVLLQSARREVVLVSALGQVADRLDTRGGAAEVFAARPEAMAYHHWAAGELFHSGYRSSLEFYTPAGDRISEFGFGMPPLQPHTIGDESWGSEPGTYFELAEDVTFDRNILHAEMRIYRGETFVGTLVAHALDEPENLPFLPWSQPYLPALGAGAPRPGSEFPSDLQYVMYDAQGAVRLTTLQRPPPETGELRAKGEHQDRVRLATDSGRYVGLALTDEKDRLHLLLLPVASLFDQVAVTVRISLVGLSLLASLALISRLSRRGGLRSLFDKLMESFYRKLLAGLLVAALVPLIGLALFIRGYVESRSATLLISSATQLVGAAQRVIEDYSAPAGPHDPGVALDDYILYWLRGVVGQEIHVYEDGVLLASSMRELFRSGLLPPRLDGEVHRELVEGGLPTVFVHTPIGPTTIPVAYAPVRGPSGGGHWIVAVPLVLEQRQISQAVYRVREMILIATVALVGLLAAAAARLARTVARPVRELVEATGRVAAGDYTVRLEPRTRDEVAGLVQSFNAMGSALERQRADLRRQRDSMELLLRHDTTGVMALDAHGTLVAVNPAAARVLALPSPQAGVGRSAAELLSERLHLARLAQLLAKPLCGADRGGQPIEMALPIAGQAPRRFQVVRVELRDDDGSPAGTLVLLDDVTDLMRSNQLAAWAEMAQVIAHEIKNPLTPIQLSTEHLYRLLEDRGILPEPAVEACLETIIKQVRTLREIAGEFSTYARLPALRLEPTDPVAFVRATVAPYRAASPAGIEIVERYREVPPVAIDQRVLSRAVVNLVENALQAMPEGGTLVVSVDHDVAAGEVVISVRDSGPGLDPEVRLRLFEPYFSTKSSGTGLGLAIVRRAVEGHGGRIDVDSRPRQGTDFRIHLPVAA